MSDTMTITDNCRLCQKTVSVSLSKVALLAWNSGEYIQDVAPDLSADEREFLISQTCGECFDAMWEDSDE